MNLFISYSHKDETLIAKFLNHLAPLKSNGVIKEWIDRKIETGTEFQENIDKNLTNADIICLMISDNFLASNACILEKNEALELKSKKGIRVIPIILSHCDWTEHKELSTLLASPTDGKPITSFTDQNEGWLDTIKWVKKVCQSINQIKSLKIKAEFQEFLNNAEILSKSHFNKEMLGVDDIFVYPKLRTYDEEEVSHKYNSESFNEEILSFNKIIIAGENQSGKTTLCKKLFHIYRTLNYVPIYLDDANRYFGVTSNNLEKAFSEQYDLIEFLDIDLSRIVPILDNFHNAKYQEKYIEQYKDFEKQVLIVDDIFGLNIRKQNLINDYKKFKIREFTAIERNELIKKWIQIKEDNQIQLNPNHLQKSIDEKTELIENSLGIIFGKGIMPSYPFFILSLLSAQETQKPLDSEITSQGHCYQALIFLYLRKQGVRNDQIDIYTNFLTELSNWIFERNGNSIDNNEFDIFIDYYKGKYNLPISVAEIVQNLSKVNISKFDSLNQYNFCYPYIYYFFVAKYISEHLVEKSKELSKILSNLHKDENAYIAVFISHHTKSNTVLDEILLNAEILFEKFEAATLSKSELFFFDNHQEKIIKTVMPAFNHNANAEREKRLADKSSIEIEENEEVENLSEDNKELENDEFANDLRLSIKTVEVMGSIMKNRSGSLDKQALENIFEQGFKVYMRILKSFIELIDNEKAEKEIVEFITERLKLLIKEKEESKNKAMKTEKIEKIAKEIYWNLNFGVLHGFISKAIHSLGSSNLLNIAQAIDDKIKSPSIFIVNQGIKMWYSKNLKVDTIVKRLDEDDFSKTAENLMKMKVVEHCRMHNIDYKDLQKIEQKLHLPTQKMLVERGKNKN